jgi:predicted MFS family arabinose efflux permease
MFTSAQATTIFGVGNVLLGVGGMLGNFFGGITKQSTGGFDYAFLLVLGASLATLLLSLFMENERKAAVTASLTSKHTRLQLPTL